MEETDITVLLKKPDGTKTQMKTNVNSTVKEFKKQIATEQGVLPPEI